MRLTREKREILRSVEHGEWRSTQGLRDEVQRYQGYAGTAVRKDKRVNIRMSEKDLVRFQKKALEEGLPY